MKHYEDNDDERQVEFGTLAEQKDEAYHDRREDADDDLEKGRIKFPKDKLYGRDNELRQLHDMYTSVKSGATGGSRIVFLAGCSGTGKSSLVEEFIQQSLGKDICRSFIQGKFGHMKAGDPFSAISQALNHYCLDLSKNSSSKELNELKERFDQVDISLGSEI